jgi:hypothetical protein
LPGIIDWITECVDLAIQKHGLTRDPQLDARCKGFLEGRPRPATQYANRNPAELAEDVNQLSDLVVKLVRERDLLLLEAQNFKMWIRILRYFVSAEGLIILFLAQQLFSRLK